MQELLRETDFLNYRSLSDFDKKILISIISYEKDHFDKGKIDGGHQETQIISNAYLSELPLVIDGVDYRKIVFEGQNNLS